MSAFGGQADVTPRSDASARRPRKSRRRARRGAEIQPTHARMILFGLRGSLGRGPLAARQSPRRGRASGRCARGSTSSAVASRLRRRFCLAPRAVFPFSATWSCKRFIFGPPDCGYLWPVRLRHVPWFLWMIVAPWGRSDHCRLPGRRGKLSTDIWQAGRSVRSGYPRVIGLAPLSLRSMCAYHSCSHTGRDA